MFVALQVTVHVPPSGDNGMVGHVPVHELNVMIVNSSLTAGVNELITPAVIVPPSVAAPEMLI